MLKPRRRSASAHERCKISKSAVGGGYIDSLLPELSCTAAVMTTSLHTRPSESTFIGQHTRGYTQTRNAPTTATPASQARCSFQRKQLWCLYHPLRSHVDDYELGVIPSVCPQPSEAYGSCGTRTRDQVIQTEMLNIALDRRQACSCHCDSFEVRTVPWNMAR